MAVAPEVMESALGGTFEMSDADFARVRDLIHRTAGIALNASKRNMVYSRLSRRLRALGMSRFSDYLDAIEQVRGAELQGFVNALTTNLTGFFREAHHFEALATLLAAPGRVGSAAVWSAACATGEEAYSIAMTGLDLRVGAAVRPRVLATDIDTSAIDTARRGVYREAAVAGLDAARVARHFEHDGQARDATVRVRDALKACVEFRPLNLLEASRMPNGKFCAIFCRNVMIYFDRAAQRRILENLLPRLEAGGTLFVGHAENLYWARDLFASCGRTAYRVVDARAGQGA